MLNHHLIAKTRPAARRENVILWKNCRITLLTAALMRIEQSENGIFCDEATQAVWYRDMEPVPFKTEDKGEQLLVSTEAVTLRLTLPIENSSVLFPDGREVALAQSENLGGTYRTLDCCDGDCWHPLFGAKGEKHAIELENGVLAKNGVAVYDDSHTLLLKEDGRIAQREHAEKDLYIFAHDRRYREAIRDLYMICGAPPVMPRYALGNWWSRYWAYTQDEYLALMDSFKERDIPFTVATVDMDWHPSENLPGGEDGWTGYSWNRELFPDYPQFLKDLHARNLKITLNLHPALGVRWFEDQYPEMAQRMGVDPETKAPVNFDLTNDDFINAYFDVLHKPYEKQGVDFWWIDWQQGTSSAVPGLDPLWSLNHYHTLDMGKEALILSRYAGVGSHRYPVGFSGDTLVTWKTLKYLPGFTSKASNVGYSWWSHDIGGHMFGYRDNELFLRFVQFGVFSPINRLHSSKVRTLSKDMASYPGGIGLIAREYLKLRHAMIPFLYSIGCETAEKGLALIEPMYYQYPDQEDAYHCEGQYLFGGQMIAAPITAHSGECGLAEADVWLPEGRWTDYFTGDTYQGGGWCKMYRPLDQFPLLFKEGGFFPLDGKPEGNSTALPTHLDVHVFPGSGSYTLTEDGEAGRLMTHFVSKVDENGMQQITITANGESGILNGRNLTLRFRHVMKGKASLCINGTETAVRCRQDASDLLVFLPEFDASARYEVTVLDAASAKDHRDCAIVRLITEVEGEYNQKEELLTKLLETTSREEYLEAVEASFLPEVWKKHMAEVQ